MTFSNPTYSNEQKEYVVCRSNQGQAARIDMYKGMDITMETNLNTLDSTYESVDNREQLLEKFYGARQTDVEDVAS